MKIIKRSSDTIHREEAHGGSGARKVYATSEFTNGNNLEAITHGFLPAGGIFDWHSHNGLDEVMIVIKGTGEVSDRDGTYIYSQGDVFIFPEDIEHKIQNIEDIEHEMIFVRVKN